MAKQTSFLTYSGKFGDTSGVKTKHGHYIRSRPKKVRQTLATQRAAYRFGRASSIAAFIRKSFCAVTDIHKDDGYINRLTKALIPSAGRDLHRLKGYRFNKAKGITAWLENNVLHIPPQSGTKQLAIHIIALCINPDTKKVLDQSISTITLDPVTGAAIPLELSGNGTWIIALQINSSTTIIGVYEPVPEQALITYPQPHPQITISNMLSLTHFIQRE